MNRRMFDIDEFEQINEITHVAHSVTPNGDHWLMVFLKCESEEQANRLIEEMRPRDEQGVV